MWCRRVRTLDDEIRSQDSHGGDTDASFGRAVGGAEAGEDDGAGATHRSEERLLGCVSTFMLHSHSPISHSMPALAVENCAPMHLARGS